MKSVIPLIPFNSFFPFLSQENGQHYFPKLLLSDYESSIQVTLGAHPHPLREGPRPSRGRHRRDPGRDRRPGGVTPGGGGYNTAVQSCYDAWSAKNKPTSPGSPYIEEQGPIVGWCQAIRLFAAAALGAGPHLDRRTFRPVDVEDPELLGHLHADALLRPRQVRRADPVPGGRALQQRPALPPVRARPTPASPRGPVGTPSRPGLLLSAPADPADGPCQTASGAPAESAASDGSADRRALRPSRAGPELLALVLVDGPVGRDPARRPSARPW